ncbi:hypothetical protein R5R35_007456 [Gryllus longicercus]|uniref:Oxidized purine nucleoside triphosphate hydrolase n=1 Tax=Gryllus longicercus TaxID=2509291 RepID=A0AAN9YY31_9ORTH
MSFRKRFTLALVRNAEEVLLGLKKRGFGEGKWNGFGGKVEAGESIHDAAVRELREESGLIVENLKYIGILDFEFAGDPKILEVHVFTTSQFTGQLVESDEMKPQWFSIQDVPFAKMWPDDEFWFPLFLKNEMFKGYFFYKDQDTIGHYTLSVVDELPSENISKMLEL